MFLIAKQVSKASYLLSKLQGTWHLLLMKNKTNVHHVPLPPLCSDYINNFCQVSHYYSTSWKWNTKTSQHYHKCTCSPNHGCRIIWCEVSCVLHAMYMLVAILLINSVSGIKICYNIFGLVKTFYINLNGYISF